MEKNLVIANKLCQSLGTSLYRAFTVHANDVSLPTSGWYYTTSSLLFFFAKLLHAKPKHASGEAACREKRGLQSRWMR